MSEMKLQEHVSAVRQFQSLFYQTNRGIAAKAYFIARTR